IEELHERRGVATAVEPREDTRPWDARVARQPVAPLPREVVAPAEAAPVVIMVRERARDLMHPPPQPDRAIRARPGDDGPVDGAAIETADVADEVRQRHGLQTKIHLDRRTPEPHPERERAVREGDAVWADRGVDVAAHHANCVARIEFDRTSPTVLVRE